MAKNKKKKRPKRKKQRPASQVSPIDEILARWQSGSESRNSGGLWEDTQEAILEASVNELKDFIGLWLPLIIDQPIEKEGLKHILVTTAKCWPRNDAEELQKLLVDFRQYLQCAIMNERHDMQRRQGLTSMEPVLIAFLIAQVSA